MNKLDSDKSQPSMQDEVDVFAKHADSVLCCDIDPRKKIAITGGVDDTAFLWNFETKQVVFECSGHQESVVAVAFNVNTSLVASGDLSGFIQARKTSTGEQVFEYNIDEINWLRWHNSYEYILFAGTSVGDVWMWNVKDPAALKIFPTSGAASVAGRILPEGLKIVSSYANGSVKVYDLKSKDAIAQTNDHNQTEIISMDVNPSGSIVAVGYIDSTVKMISTNSCRVVGTFQCKSPDEVLKRMENDDCNKNTHVAYEELHEDDDLLFDGDDESTEEGNEVIEVIDNSLGDKGDEEEDFGDEDESDAEEELDDKQTNKELVKESVESVGFSKCGNYIMAANISGSIFIWDVSTQNVRYELHTEHRISNCIWTDDDQIVTAGLDGTIRTYNSSLEEELSINAHKDQILQIAYKSKTLLSVSDDATCRVMKLD